MKKKKAIFVQKVHKKEHFGTTLCQNQDFFFFGMKTLLHFHFFQSDLLSKDRQVGLNVQSVDFVKISFFQGKNWTVHIVQKKLAYKTLFPFQRDYYYSLIRLGLEILATDLHQTLELSDKTFAAEWKSPSLRLSEIKGI